MSPILQVQNLTSRLEREGKPIVGPLSFSLFPGGKLIIKGPSGIGKSFLLRLLCFLEPLSSGEIYFNNDLISPAKIPFYRSQVILLHQKPCLIEGSVEDNLKMPFKFETQREKHYEQSNIKNKLRALDLSESFLRLPAQNLSGGEAQILAILRAMILSPKILLLDEPTASIDTKRSCLVENLVAQWLEESKDRAFIWVTHQEEQATRIGNQVLNIS